MKTTVVMIVFAAGLDACSVEQNTWIYQNYETMEQCLEASEFMIKLDSVKSVRCEEDVEVMVK